MTSKKKLGSKLANSVRQVKLQREHAPVAPAKTVTAEKGTAKPTTMVATNQPTQTRPVAPRPASKTEMKSLHPQRVWPD